MKKTIPTRDRKGPLSRFAVPLFILLASAAILPAQTLQRAEELMRQHDDKGAGHEFEALLKANPQNAQYRVRYAQLLYRDFNQKDAQDLYAEALKLDPKNADAMLGLAQILADKDQTELQ